MGIVKWLTARIQVEIYTDGFGQTITNYLYRVDDMHSTTLKKLREGIIRDDYKMFFPHFPYSKYIGDDIEVVRFTNWADPDNEDRVPSLLNSKYKQFYSDFADLYPHFGELKQHVIEDLQYFFEESKRCKGDPEEYRQPVKPKKAEQQMPKRVARTALKKN